MAEEGAEPSLDPDGQVEADMAPEMLGAKADNANKADTHMHKQEIAGKVDPTKILEVCDAKADHGIEADPCMLVRKEADPGLDRDGQEKTDRGKEPHKQAYIPYCNSSTYDPPHRHKQYHEVDEEDQLTDHVGHVAAHHRLGCTNQTEEFGQHSAPIAGSIQTLSTCPS